MLDEEILAVQRELKVFKRDFALRQKLARLRRLTNQAKSAYLEYGLEKVKVPEGLSVQETFINEAEKLGYILGIKRKPIYQRIGPGSHKAVIVEPGEIIIARYTYILIFNIPGFKG